jgi:hypothetical protein
LISALTQWPIGKTVSPRRSPYPRLLVVLPCVLACASTPAPDPVSANGPRYPRRAPGCELAVYHTPVPGIPAWDDLGAAEAMCNINDSPGECLRILKAEACRMGGDIIYNVPRKPYRPRDQVLQYRAQVAHTRALAIKQAEDPDLPALASPQESALPVVPLPSGTE